MSAEVFIARHEDVEKAFGPLGLKVGPRTGPNRRSKDDREWYVLRRFVPAALSYRLFECPLKISKVDPPDPDFLVLSANGDAFLEITEATVPADQSEMTAFELAERAELIGTFGGRFRNGASGNVPERVWAQDIVEAIERKVGKAIYSSRRSRHLIVYPNSNASFLMFDDDNELEARSLLADLVEESRDHFSSIVNGCQVHVVGKAYVFLDIIGRTPIAIAR